MYSVVSINRKFNKTENSISNIEKIFKKPIIPVLLILYCGNNLFIRLVGYTRRHFS